jgi:hypothetical protein
MSDISIIRYSNQYIYSLKNTCLNNIPDMVNEKIKKIDKELSSSYSYTSKQIKISKRNNSRKNNNNGWKKVARKKIFNGDKLNNFELIQRRINGTLNKLNKDNFNLIKNEIITITKSSENIENILEYVINCLFKKAINQESYCYLYIQLYQEIINNLRDYTELITNILITRCNGYMDTISSNNSSDLEDVENYDLICKIIEKKKNIYGYSNFIVELFNKNIIKFSLLKIFVDKLFINILEKRGNTEYELFIELNIDCIFIILTKINSEIIHGVDKQEIIKYFDCLQEYKTKTIINSKIKFKIMDIMEVFKKYS